MKKFFSLIVVIPLGPKCQLDYIADTIESIQHYARSSYHIVLVDDSQKGMGQRVQAIFPNVEVIVTKESMGKLCGLYVTLSRAFRQVLAQYHFDALLRMDTDALIIGKAPERAAIELFRKQPHVGMAGQYPLDYNGEPWDISWPRGQMIRFTRTYRFIRRPRAHWKLLMLYLRARRNGYRTGESVFGGACFFSEPCLRRLEAQGLLPYRPFKNVVLEEDHLFSLIVKAAGFELGNLSTGGPVACAWLGLPAAPEELHERGKKIIHSTRFWQERKEEEIRAFFRNQRTALNPVTGAGYAEK